MDRVIGIERSLVEKHISFNEAENNLMFEYIIFADDCKMIHFEFDQCDMNI